MHKIFWILLFSLISSDLFSQGFNRINGRNHPYLNWQVSETEHFRIMYPDYLEGIDAEAAAIAEDVYGTLAQNFSVDFDHKIRLYLTDTDEINNGFAVPAGNGYAGIWVNVNDYAKLWTGPEKWLRKVIAHELVHIFHFRVTRTGLGLLNYIVGDPIPPFWTEGLAQYQSEQWDSQRGDRWLRMAIFDSRPNYNDNRSLYNRRLMYASGSSQVRYFAEAYGDTAISELLSERESILGVAQYHDFQSAFRKSAGISYRDFYEEWRKHMNIYYNTLASQMDRVDSLNAETEDLPGRFYFDVKYSPGQSKIAVLSLHSLQKPVRQLLIVENDSLRDGEAVAEGNINNDLSWSPDGGRIAYSRKVRGENSSLVNDIFILDTENKGEERITTGRRAVSPEFSVDGSELAYIVNDSGTGNVVILDLETGEEHYLTAYEGDVQIVHLTWNRIRGELVFQRFDEEGNRHLVALETDTGGERVLDQGQYDNRRPVISPDGRKIAYTSLRDDVPNIFMADLETGTSRRVTNLFTGGTLYDWLAVSDSTDGEMLVVKATETKQREHIYLVGAGTGKDPVQPDMTLGYTTWRTQEPPNTIPSRIDPDSTLVLDRHPYNSWRNITHTVSFGLPYYAGGNDFGFAGFTNWLEPLGKHVITAGGIFSAGDPFNSYGLFSYINNQFYPTLTAMAFRAPAAARYYGRNFLIEEMTGVSLSARWPLDRLEGPYRESRINTRIRYAFTEPFAFRGYDFSPHLPDPVTGHQLDLRLTWTLKKQPPYYRNLLHPVDGYGLRMRASGSEKRLGSDTSFLTVDASAYTLLQLSGSHRLFLFGRMQVQVGEPFPQHYIGFSRIDNIGFPSRSELEELQAAEADRVRGYRDFIAGKQVGFVSAEYRMPFLPSLNTSVLGFLRLGPTALAFFADAGTVHDVTFSEADSEEEIMLGLGSEIKNMIRLGPLLFIHSFGIGQPYDHLFESGYDLYYRVKASLPF